MTAKEIQAMLDGASAAPIPVERCNARQPGDEDFQVKLCPGDVVQHECVAVVDMVDECRARLVPVAARQRTFTPRFGGEAVVIRQSQPPFSICTVVPSSRILARLGRGWKTYFPSGRRPPAAQEGDEPTQAGGQLEDQNMPAKAKKTTKAAKAAKAAKAEAKDGKAEAAK